MTDANGCSVVTTTFNVTEPSIPVFATINLNTNVSCNGGSDGNATIVPGGTAPYTYLWSIGSQTTQTATGLPAGTYSCVVTDANGCSYTNKHSY